MYLTYEEYKFFGGNITEEDFKIKSIKSKQIIDNYTLQALKGLKNIPNEVKVCLFEIVSILDKRSRDIGVTSEKVGNWSISYKDVDYEKEINDILSLYLDNLEIDGKKIFKGISLYV